MLANSNGDFASERLLYSFHKALDMVLDMGAVPQRLYRVLYPIWQVQVEGRQRISQDFEELEWYIERGLHEANLTTVEELCRFYGLKQRFVEKLVGFLQGIHHIEEDQQGRLSLTQLGQVSVQQQVRILEQDTSDVLFFDGFGSQPLTREHYQIPYYTTLPESLPFKAVYNFGQTWDEKSLKKLLARPDRDQFNLPDEVTQLRPISYDLAYLPLYIIQRRADRSELPLYLTFSRIPEKRDKILEEVVNREPLIQVPLRQANQDDLGQAVEQTLGERNLKNKDYYLQTKGPLGPQVMVNAGVLKPQKSRARADNESRSLTVNDVGRYLLAREWCVWITCDDPVVRREAAIEQLLEWLQHVTATPTEEDLQQRLKVMRDRLRIEPVSVDTLTDEATRRGLGRALERLDALLVTNDGAR